MINPHGPLWECLVSADAEAARRIVIGRLDAGESGSSIIRQLLAPAMDAVGAAWQSTRWSVADEHAATAVVDAALAAVEHGTRPRRRPHQQYVLACAETEWHSLPARLAAQLARESGASIRFLGASLPADHLREYLAQLQPVALLLSATMPTSLAGAARCIEAAHDVGVRVIAGGAGFGVDDRRARALNADAWTLDPGALDEVVWWDESGQPTRWGPYLALHTQAAGAVEGGYQRLLAERPQLRELSSAHQLRTREDLAHIVDYAATTLLVGDVTVMTTFTGWLVDVLAARRVPRELLEVACLALAAELQEAEHKVDAEAPELLHLMAAQVAA